MSKTIVVKGIGKVSVKPDYVVLKIELESLHLDYDEAMRVADQQIQDLTNSLESIGFDEGSAKTTDFDVRTRYHDQGYGTERYQKIFTGYAVEHDLRLSFDLDMEKLSQVLRVIADCPAQPEFSIMFTVKDTDAVNEELLCSAAVNARRKAEILCAASGVAMGDLIAIDYNWAELNLCSRTRYNLAGDGLSVRGAMFDKIEPDNINVSDTAAFVWELK